MLPVYQNRRSTFTKAKIKIRLMRTCCRRFWETDGGGDTHQLGNGDFMGYKKRLKKMENELEKEFMRLDCGSLTFDDIWGDYLNSDDSIDFLPEPGYQTAENGDNRSDFGWLIEETPVPMLPKPPSAKASMAKHLSYYFEILMNHASSKFLVVIIGKNRELYRYYPEFSYAKMIDDDDVGVILEETLDNFGLLEAKEKISTVTQREIIAKIKRQPELQRELDEFYKHKRKTNCATGVIDVSRAGEISVEERTQGIVFDFYIEANYIPAASLGDAQAFQKYCAISLEGNPKKIQLLLEMIGYTLFSSMDGKCFFVCVGVPNSGKSLILKLVERLLGQDLATSIPLHELGDKFKKAEIFGKRVNIVTEVSKRKLKGDDILKAMTSGDQINAEFKSKRSFDFPVHCKLWFAANEFPSLDELDTTGAFYNRMVVLCYSHSVTKAEKDPELEQKLWTEKDIIFSLAIKAYAELVRRGYEFTQPADSTEFMANYRMNENSFQRFLDEEVAFEIGQLERKVDIIRLYKHFCQRNELEAISNADIGRMLEALCKAGKIQSEKIRPVHGKGRPADGFCGLRLLTSDEE